ncbi:TetR family transcriptional regulator [Plantactinospora sp. B24E8]|uniref:TetR/AcrR family transcriptional regulator n=1 Tax=Plantactinospora sp. B24E8 TaxID=3153567 RepID=UPI00325D4CB3
MCSESRNRLLSRAVEHLAGHGVGGLSLRGLAADIGTSHRMLIYHFGSMEGLLVEVVRHVEERQRAVLTTLTRDPVASPADAIRAMWHHLADPTLWPLERLFFELYGQALQGRPGTAPLLDGVVESWLDLNVDLAGRWGVPAEVARTHARLGLAVIRGLLLDLLATGDRAGTDAAVEAFAAAYQDGLPVPTRAPAGPDSGPDD